MARGWGCVVFLLPPCRAGTSWPWSDRTPVERGFRRQAKSPLAIAAAAGVVGV